MIESHVFVVLLGVKDFSTKKFFGFVFMLVEYLWYLKTTDNLICMFSLFYFQLFISFLCAGTWRVLKGGL